MIDSNFGAQLYQLWLKVQKKETKRSPKHLQKAQKLVTGQQQESGEETSHPKEVLVKVVILTRIGVPQ